MTGKDHSSSPLQEEAQGLPEPGEPNIHASGFNSLDSPKPSPLSTRVQRTVPREAHHNELESPMLKYPQGFDTLIHTESWISGRYEIEGFIGQGSSGQVYKVHDHELGETVALKFLANHLTQEPQFIDRFRYEVSLLRQINSPYICRVFDIGSDHGRKFFSME